MCCASKLGIAALASLYYRVQWAHWKLSDQDGGNGQRGKVIEGEVSGWVLVEARIGCTMSDLSFRQGPFP
jgi:hypothetical protein